MLVPVGDEEEDGLPDGGGHLGGGVAVAGGEGDLDTVGDAAGLRPDQRANADEAWMGAGAVEKVGGRLRRRGGAALVVEAHGGDALNRAQGKRKGASRWPGVEVPGPAL